jgi:hypothetical protein
VLGLAVATSAWIGGWLVGIAVPDPSAGKALGMAAALALLLAWLLWPAPFGGGASIVRLLVPEASRPFWGAIILGLGWGVLALPGAQLLVAAGSFDLDALGWRPASGWEIGWNALYGLLLAAFHGLFCLGWAMGARMREERDLLGAWQAVALAAALPVAVLAPAGFALLGVVLGLLVTGPATVAMALVVLFGGRVWPVILVNAAAWAIAGFAAEVPRYDEAP